MENPDSWKTAELVIKEALRECDNARERGAIGASRASVVANALRASGHISDAEEPEIGWDGFRAHHAKKGAEDD